MACYISQLGHRLCHSPIKGCVKAKEALKLMGISPSEAFYCIVGVLFVVEEVLTPNVPPLNSTYPPTSKQTLPLDFPGRDGDDYIDISSGNMPKCDIFVVSSPLNTLQEAYLSLMDFTIRLYNHRLFYLRLGATSRRETSTRICHNHHVYCIISCSFE